MGMFLQVIYQIVTAVQRRVSICVLNGCVSFLLDQPLDHGLLSVCRGEVEGRHSSVVLRIDVVSDMIKFRFWIASNLLD